MQVTWLDRPRLPEVSLRLVVPAAGAEGPDQAGIAALAGRLLPEGAAGLGSRDVAAWLDGLGAHLHVSVNHDATVLRLHVLSEFLEEGLDVLRALALEPDFPSVEVQRCRAERVDAIRRLRDDPTEVSADLMAELLYGDHPYGRLARGRADSVAELERPDLVDFHRERYAPAGATLVAVGDLDGDRFRTAVEERFGRTAGHAPRCEPPPNAVASHTTGLVLVDRPGSRQSVIRIAAIGSSRGAAEEPTLREDKGWTYGARSILELRRSAGPITLRAAVDTAFTADAVREMMAEVRTMRETEPAADEMVLAAAALTRSLPLRFETASPGRSPRRAGSVRARRRLLVRIRGCHPRGFGPRGSRMGGALPRPGRTGDARGGGRCGGEARTGADRIGRAAIPALSFGVFSVSLYA
jgi:zinc protease